MKETPVTILGSTGSVGQAALEAIERRQDAFRVTALAAYRNVEALAAQARQYHAALAVIGDAGLYADLKDALSGSGVNIAAGREGLEEAATLSGATVIAAMSGIEGLAPTLKAARNGQRIALANKESLVAAGDLLMKTVRQHGAEIIPLDSEHNALFRLFLRDEARRPDAVRRVILTASGGPFLRRSAGRMSCVTPQEAVKHPVWRMGRKISVDSATMMNKGLEIIEAHHLFGLDEEKIDVALHPQSLIHAMLEMRDGAIIAHMSPPDMRHPIEYALFHPDTPPALDDAPSPFFMGDMRFEAVNLQQFPALTLARRALQCGGGAPIILNAANDEAVHAFLDGKIGFPDITRVVDAILSSMEDKENPSESAADLESVFALDSLARARAREMTRSQNITSQNTTKPFNRMRTQ